MAKDRARFVVEIDTKSAESALRRLHDAAGGAGPGGGGRQGGSSTPGGGGGGSRIPGGGGGGGGPGFVARNVKKLGVAAIAATVALKVLSSQADLVKMEAAKKFRGAQRLTGSDAFQTRIDAEKELRARVEAFSVGAMGQASPEQMGRFATAIAPVVLARATGGVTSRKYMDELDVAGLLAGAAEQGRFAQR